MAGNSKLLEKKHKRIYRQRRRDDEPLFGDSLPRRVMRGIERQMKRLSVGLFGSLLRPPRARLPISLDQVNSILFIRNDAIGDMVLSTPIWRVLKKRKPTLRIGVIASFRNAPVIANDPDVDVIYDGSGTSMRDMLRTARETRKQSWDVIIPLLYTRKTKLALQSKLFAPKAISSMLLLHDDSIERYRHLFSVNVESHVHLKEGPILDLMRMHIEKTFGITIDDNEWRPSLNPDLESVRLIQQQIESRCGSLHASAYFHINLEAKTDFKEYGLENSYDLSMRLRELYPEYAIVWTSSPIVAEKADNYLKLKNAEGIFYQRTRTIDDLIGVVRGATMVISPDTSVIHFASAEGRPVVGLYPYFHAWPPYGVPHEVLVPVYGEPVSTIPVEIVMEAVQKLMPTGSANQVKPTTVGASK